MRSNYRHCYCCVALSLAGALLGCGSSSHGGSSDAGTPNAGGGTTSGGSTGAGGNIANGGVSGGGGLANGGATDSGGATNGGATGTGGNTSSDGEIGGGGAGTTDGSVPDTDVFTSIGSPWGVAPSASSSRAFASWMGRIAAGGVTWVRGFDGSQTDAVVAAANANGLGLSGILLFSKDDPQSIPVDDLPDWTAYVTSTVGGTSGKVKFWEVWNEPPNFTADTSPADYGAVVNAAYTAAKSADATVQIGLATQSVNLNYLAGALDGGAADHFDYVTVHPYETLGLVADGFEGEFMSIVPTIRKLLADKDPSRKDVPVIFTELGEPVQGAVTAAHQADTLVKAYVLGLAQGAARIHWFEPLDGDSGPFGLIGSDGNDRPSFVALKKLVQYLGTEAHYRGWVLLDNDSYGFVFRGDKPVLVAWSRPGQTANVTLDASADVIDPGTGAVSQKTVVPLTPSPIIVSGVPESLLEEARANASRPFPWGGDYTNATSVSFTAPSTEQGLHLLGTPVITNGALDVSGGAGQSFTVDPNFDSYGPAKLHVTAVLRRNGADTAGFNLKYESTTGWNGGPGWYTVPGSDQWYTAEWDIPDAQFVGKWGYNFTFDSDSTQYSKYSIQSVTVTKE